MNTNDPVTIHMTVGSAQFVAELIEAERRLAADADDSDRAYQCARIMRSFDFALNEAAGLNG